MNIQQISESISNIRQCSNSKPPINHDIKHAEEAEIKGSHVLISGVGYIDGEWINEDEKIYSSVWDTLTFKVHFKYRVKECES